MIINKMQAHRQYFLRTKKKFLEGWNEIRGRFIESYLIYPNPKLDDGEWMIKDLNFLFRGMSGQKQGF